MAKQVNPTPYLITFIILFITALFVLTWLLDVFNKNAQCTFDPNIWCSDEWTCQNKCTGSVDPEGQPVSSCFENLETTGLASCIYGPQAPGATICLTQPDENDPTALSCNCPQNLQSGVMNCLGGCPQTLDAVAGTVCCCTTGPHCTPEACATSQ